MSEYEFKLPDLGEGMVESEIGEWFIKVGDQVTEGDVVCTMMTDKAAVELSSPVSGKVIKLAGEPGDIVAVGAAVVVFETDATSAAASTAPAEEPAPVESSPQRAIVGPEEVRAASRRPQPSGAVPKKPALQLHNVPGTGAGGRITRKDFDAYLNTVASVPMVATSQTPDRGDKHRSYRRSARNKRDQGHRAATHHCRTHGDGHSRDPAFHLRRRDRYHRTRGAAQAPEQQECRPGTTTHAVTVSRAGADSARCDEFPQCNTTYDKDRNVLIQHGPVHLGVATQTNDGLKVPVVHNADALSLQQLASEIRRVSEAARNNSITKKRAVRFNDNDHESWQARWHRFDTGHQST